MILRVIKGYLSFLREWMLAGPLHSTCLVIVCVRFSLSLLEALCVVLSATHSSLGPMTCFTYLPPCFFHDAYLLLPLLASSFTFLFQASICACLLSSTESRWPLYKKKKKRERVSAKPGNSIIWLFSRLNHALFVHYRLGLWTVDYMLLYLITQTKPIHYFDENKDGIVNRLNWRTILYGHYLYEQLGSAQLWALEQIHLH